MGEASTPGPLLTVDVPAADDAGVRQPIEIRQPAAVRIYVVAFTVFSVGLLVWGGIPSPVDVLILVFMAAFIVALAARIQMLKLVADDSGLLVRNFFRSWHFQMG